MDRSRNMPVNLYCNFLAADSKNTKSNHKVKARLRTHTHTTRNSLYPLLHAVYIENCPNTNACMFTMAQPV